MSIAVIVRYPLLFKLRTGALFQPLHRYRIRASLCLPSGTATRALSREGYESIESDFEGKKLSHDSSSATDFAACQVLAIFVPGPLQCETESTMR